MKVLITLLLAFAVWWAGKTIYGQYKSKEKQEMEAAQREKSGAGADGLTGLPAAYATSLQTAQSQGPAALKTWLDRYRPYVRDPKLADIELDYAMMVARQNPAEGKRVYQAVKARTPQSSPVYPKVKRLEATFGP